MKIAIIGSRGFIGRNISEHLSKNHSVYPVTRETIDLLDFNQVDTFLKTYLFDVVINCAAIMTDQNLLIDARNNFGIFMNFYNCSRLYGRFINTASGAEFDRTFNIDNELESCIFDRMPSDSYSWGQNMKARLCASTDRFYNLRIFNCFGSGETSTRIFPNFLRKQKDELFEITNDRYFDYFYVQDFLKIVDYYVEEEPRYSDINCVYTEKYKISQVLERFTSLNNLKNNIQIISHSDKNYTGNGEKLAKLPIELDGLEKGLASYL